MIQYQFDINKVLQIVNYLLKLNKGKINYTKLIKLLYIADKQFLKESMFNITTDSYVSAKNGPITSKIYDLIRGKGIPEQQQLWNTLFIKEGYDLKLLVKNNLSTGQLCDAEIEILTQIDKQFKKKNFNYLIEYTHSKTNFPEVEWKEAEKNNTSYPLPIENILKSLGRTDDEINIIQQEITSQEKEADFISNFLQ